MATNQQHILVLNNLHCNPYHQELELILLLLLVYKKNLRDIHYQLR